MGASSEIMLVLNVTRILTFDLFGIQFVTPPLPSPPTPRKVRWKTTVVHARLARRGTDGVSGTFQLPAPGVSTSGRTSRTCARLLLP